MGEADWYGGLEPGLDLMFPARPADPEMRESASLWLFEGNGAFAFPRIGIEAVGASWDAHRYDANFALPGGRILRESSFGGALPAVGGDGLASMLGAGGLVFRCVEPFRQWHVSYQGTPWAGLVQDQIAARFGVYAGQEPAADFAAAFTREEVRFEVALTMAAPAWTQDYRADKLAGMSEDERSDAGLMGFGYRIEQLLRGEGEFTVGGTTRGFRAVGTRIKRQSVRPMGSFRGHCWQGALFPDGRGFGYIAYPPREDGSSYNNGFVWQDGRWHVARATKIPFLRRVIAEGDDVSLELESALGTTRISGTTMLSTFHVGNPGVNGMTNQQSAVRYGWDGMAAMGMIERSSPAALTVIG